jgi:hypothetical protein
MNSLAVFSGRFPVVRERPFWILRKIKTAAPPMAQSDSITIGNSKICQRLSLVLTSV